MGLGLRLRLLRLVPIGSALELCICAWLQGALVSSAARSVGCQPRSAAAARRLPPPPLGLSSVGKASWEPSIPKAPKIDERCCAA